MCQKLFTVVLLIISCQLYSQNLVPNPGFENIIECPGVPPGNTEIHFAEPWIPVRPIDGSTSDLWNDCVFFSGNDPWGQLDFYGYNYTGNPPLSGLSRARIGVFALSNNNYREYIQVPLIESLTIGQTYRVKIHLKNDVFFSIAANQIGALFTEERLTIYDLFPYYGNYPADSTNSIVIEHYPQVKCDSLFTAQEDYGVIEGLFTADKAYAYMSLGIFTPDEKLNYQYLNSEDVEATSLIIDDVSVEAVTVGLDEGMESVHKVYLDGQNIYIEPQEKAKGFVLYSIMGKEVYSVSQEIPVGGQTVLALPNLPQGLYVYQLLNKQGQAIYTNKLILH